MRLTLYAPTRRKIDRSGAIEADTCYDQRDPEKQPKVVGQSIKPDSRRGGYRHRQVIAQTIIADTLVAPRGGQRIYCHRAVCHRRRTEWQPMKRTYDTEQK